ncbi:MAG TPA: hypothetical protein VIO38_17245 [Rariglobus sp.]
MPYTTHGYMTAADLAEVRADYDLDLCPCCEADGCVLADDDDVCANCLHELPRANPGI